MADGTSLRILNVDDSVAIEGVADVRRTAANDVIDPDVWSGRALQESSTSSAVSGLASMYPAFGWSIALRAIMDISARAISLADRPRQGHSGHQCSHAPGRPNLHLVSSSRRPRQVS